MHTKHLRWHLMRTHCSINGMILHWLLLSLGLAKARGILVPRPGVELVSLALEDKVFSLLLSDMYVQIWELDHKEGCMQKKWCFLIVVLEKILESPLDSKEIKPVNLKGNQPLIFIGRNDQLKPKLQHFGYLMQRTNSLEKILILGKSEGKRRRGQ